MKRRETHRNRPLRSDPEPLDPDFLAEQAPAFADRCEAAPPPPTRLMTRKEVHNRYGIPERRLELAPARGEGPPFVRIGRSVYYRRSDIEEWIEAQVVRPEKRRD